MHISLMHQATFDEVQVVYDIVLDCAGDPFSAVTAVEKGMQVGGDQDYLRFVDWGWFSSWEPCRHNLIVLAESLTKTFE